MPACIGVEVEISASGEDDRRTHKDVLEREINGRPAYTAVFDKIREGSYTLWVDDVACERDVLVSGGAISELDWSARVLAGELSVEAQARLRPAPPPVERDRGRRRTPLTLVGRERLVGP